MLKLKGSIEHVPVYVPGKPIEEVLKEYGVKTAIKLASNENPLGFSPKVKEAIDQHISQLFYYPDGKAGNLRTALSSFLGVKEEQLLFGAGGEDLIQMVSAAFLEKGSNTVMSGTTFPNYKINALIECAEVREVPSADGHHDLESMSRSVDDRTRIVWVCNPNNPTGTYVGENDLVSFIERIPSHVLIVLDEAYYEYATAPDYPNSIALLKKFPNLLIIRTFSKAYGLAGLRIGYAIADEAIVAQVNKVRKPFNTSSLAQVAAIAALKDQDFVRRTIELNAAELAYFYQQLDRLGLSYYRSYTNFIYMDAGMTSREMYERLLSHGVIIRPFHGNYIRVSMGLHEQNEIFFTALQKVLNEN